MRSKYIPLIVTLLAALVVSITLRLNGYELELSLWILVLTVVIFFFIGHILSVWVRKFENEAEERERLEAERLKEEERLAEVSAEGEVYQKNLDGVAP